MNASFPTPPEALMAPILRDLRPGLDRQLTLKARCSTFWAAVKNSRGWAPGDALTSGFFELARDTGLLADLRPHGAETVRHLVGWGLRGMNPFEIGPLL
jgi:hypothetical protein